MQSEIGFVVKPPLRKSGKAAAEILHQDCEALFLNLPKTIDHLVAEIPFGLDYGELVEETRRQKLLPEPVEAWLKDSEPILRKLKEIGDKVLTYCYKDPASFAESVRTSHQIALMTVRDSLRGRIDVDEWIEELKKEAVLTRQAIKREAELMESEASAYEKNICLAGFEGKSLRNALKDRFKTWIKYVNQPYCFTPLDVLRREMSIKEVSSDRALYLIKEHLKFIHDYVLTNELDEAYMKWARRKLYWHGRYAEQNS